MAEVEVIKASDGVVNRRRYEGTGLKLDRKRVAAYVRVSTDDEEQLNSFQSQSTITKKSLRTKNGHLSVSIPMKL